MNSRWDGRTSNPYQSQQQEMDRPVSRNSAVYVCEVTPLRRRRRRHHHRNDDTLFTSIDVRAIIYI